MNHLPKREIQSSLRARLSELIAAQPHPPAPPEEAASFDAIVSHVEVTEQHGVGVLLKRLFGTAPGIISIRSQDQFGGEQQFGERQLRLHHGNAPRPAVYASVAALDGRIGRILACPYFADDVWTAIALADVHGARLCTWLMDDQNLVEKGIPDALMRELLERSRVRFAISGPMRDAYEAKYGLEIGVLPPTVSPHLVQVEALALPRTALTAGRAAIVGNVWGQHWLNLLRRALAGSGLRWDWFCNSGARWLQASKAELALDGLIVRGSLANEMELKRELQGRPFAIVPSGTLEEGRETAASKFVEAFGLGATAGYESNQIMRAIDQLLNPETQRRMRARAAALAPSFSSGGVRDWLWGSLDAGRPLDQRFEDLLPRSYNIHGPETQC